MLSSCSIVRVRRVVFLHRARRGLVRLREVHSELAYSEPGDGSIRHIRSGRPQHGIGRPVAKLGMIAP
jgi:hypothetical protein